MGKQAPPPSPIEYGRLHSDQLAKHSLLRGASCSFPRVATGLASLYCPKLDSRSGEYAVRDKRPCSNCELRYQEDTLNPIERGILTAVRLRLGDHSHHVPVY